MGLDPLSPAAPAHLRSLLVPVGRVRQSRFVSFLKRLEKDNVVRLGDVSPDSRPHRTLFSPLAFPEGLIVYDLSTNIPPLSHLAMIPFELYRQPLLVVGVLDGRQDGGRIVSRSESENTGESENDHESLRHSLDDLRADFPNALLHHLIIFDHEKGQESLPEGVSSVPLPEKSRTTTIKTVMCDMTSRLLGEFPEFLKKLQSGTILETPKALHAHTVNDRMLSALPSHLNDSSRPGSSSDRPRSFSPAGDDSRSSHRISLPAHMPSNETSRSATPNGREISPAPGSRESPTTFDEISGVPNVPLPPSPRKTSQDGSRTTSLERESRQKRSESLGDREKIKAKGRVGVVLGGMYLLAGRWPDAVKELVQSANITRSNSDYVWQAKALDYLLVCLLMFAWAGKDFRIPDVLRPGAERPGSNSSKSTAQKNAASLQEVSTSQSGDRLLVLQSLVVTLPDLVNNILNLYSRAWTFTDEKIPPLSYSHSTIRFAKLLVAVRQENGTLNESLLSSIVLNRISQSLPPPAPPGIKSFMSASELSNLLFRAYPTTSSESPMPLSERTNILAAIASVLSGLGYHRKKAVVLKELLSTLLPALVQARKDGAAEMGVHPAASLASLNAATGSDFEDPSKLKEDDAEQAMRQFLSLVCQSFGLISRDHSQRVSPQHGDSGVGGSVNESAASVSLAVQQASMTHVGNQDLKIDILRSCINICEALPNLAGALQYSAELLRTAGSGIAPGPDSGNASPALPIEEQMRLANNISRTLSAAQHLGIRHPEANYWDEFLVRGVEHVNVNPSKLLVPHLKSELEIVETIQTKKEKNPFIYNPFLKASNSTVTEFLLVAEEEAIFRVTLQNLYDFDLHIERIRLETDDIRFKSNSQSTMIGPYRTQTLLLGGKSQVPGTVNVLGCLVKIRGCRERSFLIFKEPWELKVDVKGHNIRLGISTMEKRHNDSVDIKTTEDTQGLKSTPLSLKIIAAQPSLQLARLSLPQAAIMLLEGETRTFTITLQNKSPITPADIVLLSFTDSTSSHLQSVLASKELSEMELYELELSASRKSLFRWLREGQESTSVGPRGETTIEIEVRGKPGLSYGTVQIDYGYLGPPTEGADDKFFTRQLKIPIAVTVNASVDLVRSDLNPLLTNFNHRQWTSPHSEEQSQRQLQSTKTTALMTRSCLESDLPGPCTLLLLDFKNSWPTKLTLSLTLATQTTLHAIPPGTTIRLPLPYPKFYLPPSHTRAPIPNLNPATARQFVVSSSSSSAGVQNAQAQLALREAFWFREEILSQLSARWMEETSGRSGEVEMRSFRLTGRMLSSIRLGDIGISMAIHAAEPEDASLSSSTLDNTTATTDDNNNKSILHPPPPPKSQIPTSTFLTLKTTLHNRSKTPIHPLLRLQPTISGQQPHNIALDLSKKLLVNGILQRPLPLLNPGEERSVETGFCVLSAGCYEWGACVEEVRKTLVKKRMDGKEEQNRTRAKTGDLDLMGSTAAAAAVGRRVWYADEPCVFVAR